MTTRVLIADDHPMLRAGLVRSLRDSGFDIVGQASSGSDAVQLAAELHPDVVLMDVTLGDMDGVEATRQVVTNDPGVRVLMLTMHADQVVLDAAVRAGAAGYLLKDCSTDDITRAILTVAKGRTVFAPQLSASVADERATVSDPSSDD